MVKLTRGKITQFFNGLHVLAVQIARPNGFMLRVYPVKSPCFMIQGDAPRQSDPVAFIADPRRT